MHRYFLYLDGTCVSECLAEDTDQAERIFAARGFDLASFYIEQRSLIGKAFS